MFVSVANGDVMPLKGMIIGNNKTKKKNLRGLPTRCPQEQPFAK